MAKTKEQRERYEQHVLDLEGVTRPPRRLYTGDDVVRLHEALEPFLSIPELRRCVAEQRDVYEALRCDKPPKELRALMNTLAVVLRPQSREQVKSPSDVAAFLISETLHLDQEELRTIMLDTRNRIIGCTVVYRGSLNAASVRIGELFKEALKRNSAAIILSHNHPSTFPEPSPEDVLLTSQAVEAGKLLDCEVLDHIITGGPKWVSLREKGLGFSKGKTF